MLLYVHSSIAIILMGKRELVALLNLPSWCLVMVERLFLAVPRGCLRFVIVVFPDHTHLLFLSISGFIYSKLRSCTYMYVTVTLFNTLPKSLQVLCYLSNFAIYFSKESSSAILGVNVFVSSGKHGRHIGIMTPSASSMSSASLSAAA